LKIGIISPSLRRRGGIERVPVMQAKLLSESGYKVYIITSLYEKSCYSDLLATSNVTIRTPKIRTPFFEVTINTIYSAFKSYLSVSDLDLVICHMLADAYNVKRKLGIPCILYLHTLPRHPKRSVAEAVDKKFRSAIMIPPHLLYKIVNPVILRWSDLALLESNILLVNSRNIGLQLEEYIGRRDYTVCYPAIDTNHLKRRRSEIERMLIDKYGFGKTLILSVSRHQPKKCLHWLPEILHHVLKDVPDAQLAITGGETPHTELIRKSMHRWHVENRIILTGEVNDEELAALYHIAKVLCFPSVREDFGLPIIEAMYCGCPPLAWDDQSGPSEIIQSGVDGLLFKPYDLKEIARGLVLVLKDWKIRSELARNASIKGRKFSWKNHIDIIETSIKKASGKS